VGIVEAIVATTCCFQKGRNWMGQAKKRGTSEARLAEALGLRERKVADVRKELGLPEDAEYLGYIVHLPEKDEFLHSVIDNSAMTSRGFADKPENAKTFKTFDEAYKLARKAKGEVVAVLFETDNRYFVAPVE
jgi:hypothetical protein